MTQLTETIDHKVDLTHESKSTYTHIYVLIIFGLRALAFIITIGVLIVL